MILSIQMNRYSTNFQCSMIKNEIKLNCINILGVCARISSVAKGIQFIFLQMPDHPLALHAATALVYRFGTTTLIWLSQ